MKWFLCGTECLAKVWPQNNNCLGFIVAELFSIFSSVCDLLWATLAFFMFQAKHHAFAGRGHYSELLSWLDALQIFGHRQNLARLDLMGFGSSHSSWRHHRKLISSLERYREILRAAWLWKSVWPCAADDVYDEKPAKTQRQGGRGQRSRSSYGFDMAKVYESQSGDSSQDPDCFERLFF